MVHPCFDRKSLADPDHPSRMQHEGQQTETWVEQLDVEERVLLIRQSPSMHTTLARDVHIAWLHRSLHQLPRGYDAFDSLQPWAAFWIVHSLNLLHSPLAPEDAELLVAHLRTFADPVRGAYGGGPRQAGHLASTFALVMALIEVGTDDALAAIDVPAVTRFLRAMKRDDGAFRVSEGGETDVRSVYCALAVASILNVDPDDEWVCRGVPEFVASLQAFDGGLGGEPGAEAHGGNTYCGLAALTIARKVDAVDRARLLEWAVMRQMPFEGGFQGRTNKLVDSCYSFWVGSVFPLLAASYAPTHATAQTQLQQQRQDKSSASESASEGPEQSPPPSAPRSHCLFDADRLQQYIIECCQVQNGGLRDKPGAARDLMHTCYALSGLSIAQHYGGADDSNGLNAVAKINVPFNLREDRMEKAVEFFRQER